MEPNSTRCATSRTGCRCHLSEMTEPKFDSDAGALPVKLDQI